jgi:hypothetical protein
MTSGQPQKAKNKLSEPIDQSLSEGPASPNLKSMTHHDIEIAMVISSRLGNFFLTSPLSTSELILDRNPSNSLRHFEL